MVEKKITILNHILKKFLRKSNNELNINAKAEKLAAQYIQNADNKKKSAAKIKMKLQN